MDAYRNRPCGLSVASLLAGVHAVSDDLRVRSDALRPHHERGVGRRSFRAIAPLEKLDNFFRKHDRLSVHPSRRSTEPDGSGPAGTTDCKLRSEFFRRPSFSSSRTKRMIFRCRQCSLHVGCPGRVRPCISTGKAAVGLDPRGQRAQACSQRLRLHLVGRAPPSTPARRLALAGGRRRSATRCRILRNRLPTRGASLIPNNLARSIAVRNQRTWSFRCWRSIQKLP